MNLLVAVNRKIVDYYFHSPKLFGGGEKRRTNRHRGSRYYRDYYRGSNLSVFVRCFYRGAASIYEVTFFRWVIAEQTPFLLFWNLLSPLRYEREYFSIYFDRILFGIQSLSFEKFDSTNELEIASRID